MFCRFGCAAASAVASGARIALSLTNSSVRGSSGSAAWPLAPQQLLFTGSGTHAGGARWHARTDTSCCAHRLSPLCPHVQVRAAAVSLRSAQALLPAHFAQPASLAVRFGRVGGWMARARYTAFCTCRRCGSHVRAALLPAARSTAFCRHAATLHPPSCTPASPRAWVTASSPSRACQRLLRLPAARRASFSCSGQAPRAPPHLLLQATCSSASW